MNGSSSDKRSGVGCLALAGGVGGAKLVVGLTHVMDPVALLVVANTGDDFEHLGLHISPDLDTLTYTLAGLNHPETGWGRADETWTFMAALETLGGETWFRLGDGDLATHIERTRRLRAGETLTAITADFCARLGVSTRVVPMSDDPVRTVVETPDGPLTFQDYFVRDRCQPVASGFRFAGVAAARANPVFFEALSNPDLSAVVICPSNPFISIDPILALPEVRAGLTASPAPVIAVSPIVGGRAIKGPTAKMMRELGTPCTALAVAGHYGDLLDGFVLDSKDAALAGEVQELGVEVLVTKTVMESLEDRISLAHAVLDFAGCCGQT
ncbi:MAG: 2-phospho-L-lactate transferase [Alphaproteobacteria bacterium]